MRCLRWMGIVLLFSTPWLCGADQLFEIKPVVDGVYAAIAKPQYKVNCNAAIVLLEDAVLVVDTHSKPSAARALIAQIKTITDKPVKYVVNSHFHWDHYQGNQAYPSSWPSGVEIISSEATRESIEHRGIPRVKYQITTMPHEIEKLKADLAQATEANQKVEIEENLRQAQEYLEELRTMQVTLPNLTFDRSLIIHDKARTVEILWLGKAHTDGDIFVYLPKERFIATGDALHRWTPYMADSYPFDWIETLDAAEKLDFDYALGGHGDVMRGKGQFELWKQYFTDLMAETASAFGQGATLDEARKRIAPSLQAKYTGKFPETFPKDVIPNIEKAYRVVSGQTD